MPIHSDFNCAEHETSAASPAQFGVLVGLETKLKTYVRLWIFFLRATYG